MKKRAPLQTNDAEFDQFWAEYPRREGTSKKTALEAYRRARRTASAGEILTGLRAYPFSPVITYMPHATTWLNQRRWERHTDNSPPTVAPPPPPPPSRSSYLSRYDDPTLPFGCTPAARRARLDAVDPFTIDVQSPGD